MVAWLTAALHYVHKVVKDLDPLSSFALEQRCRCPAGAAGPLPGACDWLWLKPAATEARQVILMHLF